MLYITPKINKFGCVIPTIVSQEEACELYKKFTNCDLDINHLHEIEGVDFVDDNFRSFLWVVNEQFAKPLQLDSWEEEDQRYCGYSFNQ